MAFQTPITVKKALDNIASREFVLPAIQREFVWKPTQICRLFDSLMRGYPIGSFLFWKVARENTRQFKFYDFVLNYHQKDNPHCPRLELTGDRAVTAVLDGQQRLTALNIGLRGSHALKEPRMWWNNPDAFPAKRLYLNLLAEADDNEEGMQYDFRFLKQSQAGRRDEGHFWFPVWSILDMSDAGPALHEYLMEHDLQNVRDAFGKLYHLHDLIHAKPFINFYLEEEQDLDKVLNIFIRINSGGTVLSYSDLLLSIATAQWEKIDARKVIHKLVDELNNTREGFNISKDFVLKAGLMLSDISSVGFKVTNFNADNMAVLESNWQRIAQALRTTVQLVAQFGFSEKTISAVSALLPIAYYLYQREADEKFIKASQYQEDRENIRLWLIRSLLKSGIWGSGLDTILTALRATIQECGQDRFPVDEIEKTMTRRGRSLRFEEDEIQDLVDVSYGDSRAFAILSLVYSFVDLRNNFHVDHIFPRSLFSDKKLVNAGVPPEKVSYFSDRFNRLPNLQLLDERANREKTDQLPADWLKAHFADDIRRDAYIERHDLGQVPPDIRDFDQFYEARRNVLAQRLRDLLGVEPPRVRIEGAPLVDEESMPG